MFTDRTQRNRAYLFAALVMLVCILFTLSRAGWIATSAGILLSLLLQLRRYRPKDLAPYVLTGLLILLGVGLISSNPVLYQRFLLINLESIPVRLARDVAGLRAFLSAPILGVGPDNFILRGSDFVLSYSEAIALRDKSFSVANFYLRIAAEVGLVGLSALAWLLYNGIRHVLTSVRKATSTELLPVVYGMSLASAANLVHMASSSLLLPFPWLMFFMTVTVARHAASREAAQAAPGYALEPPRPQSYRTVPDNRQASAGDQA